ncbi:GNAT family N-acetyltransferase [Tenacibaculum halocynthiae]|uniref:GNAT family N-acetyltransferase n=1 Tax=Tenacibaculum halocynthiae TaxID=1254437 RepID=UPI003D647503
MATEVRQINFSDVLPIRHKVMWPNMPVSYVKLEGDMNARHFGLFVNGKITSIISLFTKNNEVQFRKFATLIEYQGLGHGTVLLKNIINVIKKEGAKRIWCNARVEKEKFYKKFDLKATTNKFSKGGIEYVIMENIID